MPKDNPIRSIIPSKRGKGVTVIGAICDHETIDGLIYGIYSSTSQVNYSDFLNDHLLHKI